MNVADLLVVVAACNEEQVIGRVVAGLHAVAPNIVVVDDGSVDNTAECARAAGATVLRHCINLGQGAALQTGLDYGLRHGFSYLATFDADGQHRASDIPEAVAALRKSGAEVLLGSRFLGSALRMSPLRRAVLRLAVAYTRLTTGLNLTDTHNGFRVLTRAAAQTIQITQDRMSHASEIIEQIALHRLSYIEFPVEIRYTDYSVAKGQRLTGALNIVVDSLVGRLLR